MLMLLGNSTVRLAFKHSFGKFPGQDIMVDNLKVSTSRLLLVRNFDRVSPLSCRRGEVPREEMEVQLDYRNDIKLKKAIMRLAAIKPTKRILRMPAVEMFRSKILLLLRSWMSIVMLQVPLSTLVLRVSAESVAKCSDCFEDCRCRSRKNGAIRGRFMWFRHF